MVTYRQNGTLRYQSAVPPMYPLRADTAMYDQWAAIDGVVLSGVLEAVAVSAPVLSVAPGIYATPQTVLVTVATPGATIHYTTTGVDPIETDPAITSGDAVPVNESLTLKASAPLR